MDGVEVQLHLLTLALNTVSDQPQTSAALPRLPTE